jgi:hypothetical protein
LVRCEPPRNTGPPSYPVWRIPCVTLSPPMPAQLRRHHSNFVELSASPPSPPSSICKLIRSSRRPPWSLAAESRRSFARGMARAGSGRAQTADLAGSAAELRRDTLKLGLGELRGDRLDRARQYRKRVSRALGGLSDPGPKAARKREVDRRASMSGTTAGASLGSAGLAPPLPKSPATPKLSQGLRTIRRSALSLAMDAAAPRNLPENRAARSSSPATR